MYHTYMHKSFRYVHGNVLYCAMAKHTAAIINERRQKLWTLITRGMKAYEIANEHNVDHSTISRDIKYLTAQSQSYLNSLAKEILPFMYQTSIEGIRDVINQCWTIYQIEDNSKVNMYQKLAALKLINECHEAVFHLVDSGPSVMYLKQSQERLVLIENRQAR
jgi:IS30 family transposase